VSFIVVLGLGGAQVASGAIDVGTLIAFLLYLYYLLPPMQGLVGAASQYQVGAAAVARIRQAERLPIEPDRPPPSSSRPGPRPPRSPSTRCTSATAPSSPRPTATSASASHRAA
jgi:ABC-type multidrug transport system fused ATPase/permease subunit